MTENLLDHSRDCFGREKHSEYRDDMGGVGTFNRTNRTLYIAKMQESPDKKQTEETLLRHFGEWGKIVKCGYDAVTISFALRSREFEHRV